MPNRTYAFSHRQGFWKSRYSFISNAFAYLNSFFFSSPPTFTDDIPLYQHDTAGSANNTFHGETIPTPSAITMTFNDNVSQEKLYKSASIEGQHIEPGQIVSYAFTQGGINQLNPRYSNINYVNQYGSDGYGIISGVQGNTGMSMRAVGTVRQVVWQSDPQAPTAIFYIEVEPFGNNVSSLQSSTGSVLFYRQEGPTGFFYYLSTAEEDRYNPDDGTTPPTINVSYANNILTVVSRLDETTGAFATVGNPQNLVNNTIFAEDTVYFLSDDDSFGDQLKGQWADVFMSLGSNDFELYCVNVEYEPLGYDHAGGGAPQRK